MSIRERIDKFFIRLEEENEIKRAELEASLVQTCRELAKLKNEVRQEGTRRRRLTRSQRTYIPPGYTLDRFLEFVLSKRVYEGVISPTVSDMRHEYFSALHKGQIGKARWIVVRGNVSIVSTFVAQIPVSLLGLVVRLWKIGH